ncbi:MAG: helix-turn-helix transcriptional regulator [Clostridia bacterium]|nr:helix-turn-helix transcriptional regulator [Clostridia bacterium]
MSVYEAVKLRILHLCEEKRMTINKLAMESGVPRSSVKNILYGKSRNPGIVTLKMLCDGLGVTLGEFFDAEIFKDLEQEIQ